MVDFIQYNSQMKRFDEMSIEPDKTMKSKFLGVYF